MKNNLLTLLVIATAISFSACKNKSKTTTTETGEEIVIEQKGDAVCIWDKVSLKETPANDGKWLAAISLGEMVDFLDSEKEVTTGDKTVKYLKVELQDGKQGWVQSDFIIVNGKPGAILQDAVIYSRPDLLTKTGKSFSRMDIVGVKGEQNGFVEVAGKRKDGKWIETGWIKPANITSAEIDVAVAKYASKALAIAEEDKKTEAINEILENSDLQNSVFIEELKSMVSPTEESLEEAVEEAEGDTSNVAE
jgi:hypothetical protein